MTLLSPRLPSHTHRAVVLQAPEAGAQAGGIPGELIRDTCSQRRRPLAPVLRMACGGSSQGAGVACMYTCVCVCVCVCVWVTHPRSCPSHSGEQQLRHHPLLMLTPAGTHCLRQALISPQLLGWATPGLGHAALDAACALDACVRPPTHAACAPSPRTQGMLPSDRHGRVRGPTWTMSTIAQIYYDKLINVSRGSGQAQVAVGLGRARSSGRRRLTGHGEPLRRIPPAALSSSDEVVPQTFPLPPHLPSAGCCV